MNSLNIPDQGQVIEELGVAFLQAFISSVDDTRDDYAAFREWRPDWAANATGRFVANLLHDRIWAHLNERVQGIPELRIVDEEPRRELHHGLHYVMRVKRHSEDDRVATVDTPASRQFWLGQNTLDGLEQVNLALGYRWIKDIREVGEPVLTYRNGKNNPIWAVELNKTEDQTAGFTWTSVEPDLPDLDFSTVVPRREEEKRSS